jgi:prepilin-type N-terminal cleavage/methylation domain-containing protein
MKRFPRCGGYTLIELVVVVLIVGILAAYGVPQYLRSVEISRADDAVALVNMIGTTNRMFAMDHNNTFASGDFPWNGSGGCGAGACPASGPYSACDLVFCKYLADQDFGIKLYRFSACRGVGACAGQAGAFVAGARRENPSAAPYDTWALTMDVNGRITAYGTSPPTPTY